MKKLFLSLALMLSAGLWAETQSVSYRYPVYNTDGDPTNGIKEWKTGTVNATVITDASSRVNWNTGWYVVNSTVTLSQGAVCSGAVHLILADGANLTATGGGNQAGIQVSGTGNLLTIYGQVNQSGQLIAKGENYGTGIGGGNQSAGSNITINGGKVTANGGGSAAGIGGGNGYNSHAGSGSYITINNGTVTATGGQYAAGIGGGNNSAGSYITINGGAVTANGGQNGAGIGGGNNNASGSNITINGGMVTANGGYLATGIGGGRKGSSSNIKVATTLVVIADGTNPPATEIAKDRTDTTDIASDLAGRQYVMIKHIPNPEKSSPMAVEVTKSGKAIQAVANPEYVDYYQQADSSKVDIIKYGTVVYSVVNPDKVDYVYDGFVDLGLPSGTLWAACNIGATKPEEFGNYYAWGDPRDKTDFSWGTYPYGNSVNNCTKYQNDGKWTLEPEDDMATVIWGPRWRIPTMADFQELLNQCDTIITTYQGVYGVLFISKVNLNSLFLPAAGTKVNTSLNSGFAYWSSSIVDMAYGNAGWLAISGGGWSGYRDRGFSVRPVMDAINASDHECVFIKGQVKKTEYLPGDTFDFTGLEAYYVPVRGVATKLTDGVTWEAYPAIIPAGCTSVAVAATYNGITSEPLTVNVITKDIVPTITPGSCSFEQSITVTIASKESGATIYYTLDGTDPTTKSTVYKAPFSIEKSTVVKAIAVKNGYVSGVGAALYTKYQLEYVDLGLPSGTLWAAYNVGAAKPEEFGNYYAWGEIATKEHYNWDSYKWGRSGAFTKYQNDGKTVLDPEDDVATVKFGSDWHTPTREDWKELLDNCSETYQGQGITGSWFKSKKNGQQIFIVCAFDAERTGQRGILYWTSSVDNIADGSANYVYRGDKTVVSQTEDRFRGLPIRPVSNPATAPVPVSILHIEGELSKKEYLIGETFDVTGLDVYYQEKGKEDQKVTDKVNWTFFPATITDGCTSVTAVATYKDLVGLKEVKVDIYDLKIAEISNTQKTEMTVSLFSDRKDVTIYYTLDGTTPTKWSNKYTIPFAASHEAIITAVAIKDGYRSRVKSATFADAIVPEYVNLGLPSGTLWAAYNIGATKNLEGGDYYAWGEITTKEHYDWDSYKWGQPGAFTKYQNDGKTILDSEDDPATAYWGPEWRTPTKEEWKELLDNCGENWRTYSDMSGSELWSRINYKQLFLPCIFDAEKTSEYGIVYWTSSVDNSAEGSVNYVYKSNNYVISQTTDRKLGLPVRAVYVPPLHLQINGELSTKEYFIGDTLDVTGLDVYYRGNREAARKVTDQVTWTFEPATVTDGCSSVKVTATYNGYAASKTVKVDICDLKMGVFLNPDMVNEMTVSIFSERKDATIYYTIDGTTPTGNSNKYTIPFVAPSEATVTAVAIKDGHPSRVKSATIAKAVQLEYVDLGLPSGIKWASFNIGATKSDENGNYFAWGETDTKSRYDKGNYFDTKNSGSSFIKYKNNGGKTTLDPEDDAAYMNWGPDWRMPTAKEIDELLSDCRWQRVDGEGIAGYYVTGKNGNVMFFPAAGLYEGGVFAEEGIDGCYWSSSIYEKHSAYAWTLDFGYVNLRRLNDDRHLGFTIRPVYDPKK